jgi:tetratricopeptide (TPR) repeat protein
MLKPNKQFIIITLAFLTISNALKGQPFSPNDVNVDPNLVLEFLLKNREKDPADFLELNREIARLAIQLGKIDLAERAVDEILIYQKGNMDALTSKGKIHQLRGKYKLANACYQQVLQTAEDINNPAWQAAALINIGNIYYIQDQPAKAEEFNLKALNIKKYTGFEENAAKAYDNLGLIYFEQGQLIKAEQMHNKALDINRKLGRLEGIANAYGNLGLIHQVRGDLVKAEQMHNKALNLNKKLKRLEGIVNCYGNLGNIYYERGELNKAAEMYRKVLDIEEKLGRPGSIATSLANLGIIFMEIDDLDKAEMLHKQALEIDSQLDNKAAVARHYSNLGAICSKRGDFNQAKDYWGRAKRQYEQIGMKTNAQEINEWLNGLKSQNN